MVENKRIPHMQTPTNEKTNSNETPWNNVLSIYTMRCTMKRNVVENNTANFQPQGHMSPCDIPSSLLPLLFSLGQVSSLKPSRRRNHASYSRWPIISPLKSMSLKGEEEVEEGGGWRSWLRWSDGHAALKVDWGWPGIVPFNAQSA